MASQFSIHCSLAFFLLVSIFCCKCLHIGGEKIGSHGHHAIDIRSLLPGDICSTSKDLAGSNTAALIEIAHRHGPCSPLRGAPKLDQEQILRHDRLRAAELRLRRSSATSRRGRPRDTPATSTTIPASSGNSLGVGNYVVTVGLGTPKQDFSVIFDTGSDVTWIQCKPCVSCYQQQDPLFDPSRSATYKNISCKSAYCSGELGSSSCSDSTCLYGVQYGDNSYTVGFYAQETLTLASSDALPGFRFGCGEKNRGIFGQVAGLLGLGRGKPSLVSQAFQRYGGVFSYCLPSTSSSTGYLAFGGGSSPAAASNVKFTPMLTESSMPTFYFVDLVAISVGGKQLPISSSVFSNAGTLLDSGTVISRLPPDAYSALRSAFRRQMSGYKSAPAFSILDTCYDLSGYSKVSVPTVALLYRGGVAMNLDVSGILYALNSSQVCLAFAGNSDASDVGIIGNVQQRKFNVVYDVSKKAIGFGPGACY